MHYSCCSLPHGLIRTDARSICDVSSAKWSHFALSMKKLTKSSYIFFPGLIVIFGVLSFFPLYDWLGKNHTGCETEFH